MSEKYELPNFEDDEERDRYFKLVTTLKQEYINNMVTFLFVNTILQSAGGDKEYIDKVLDRMTEKFKQQILIISGTDKSTCHVNLKDGLDVQNIIDGIVSDAASATVETQDPILYFALNNVCAVFTETLKQAFDAIYKHAGMFVVDKD